MPGDVSGLLSGIPPITRTCVCNSLFRMLSLVVLVAIVFGFETLSMGHHEKIMPLTLLGV